MSISLPLLIAKVATPENIVKMAGKLFYVYKNKLEHTQHSEKKQQNHNNDIEMEYQNIGKENHNHQRQTEKSQQSHNNEIIQKTFDSQRRIVEGFFAMAEEERKEKIKHIDARLQEMEKRNNDNILFLGRIFSQREDHFNHITSLTEQIADEIKSSSKEAEDCFYEHLNFEKEKDKIKLHRIHAEKLFEEIKDDIVRIKHDINNIEDSLKKSDGKYEQIIIHNPAIINGHTDSYFFKYADFVLKKYLAKNRKEIELIDRMEDKDRIENDLINTKAFLAELEHYDRNSLFKLISNITSARKLSGIIPTGKKIKQESESGQVIEGVMITPQLELTSE